MPFIALEGPPPSGDELVIIRPLAELIPAMVWVVPLVVKLATPPAVPLETTVLAPPN